MSFLPDDDSFQSFLEASLERMQRECTPAYNTICQVMAPRQVAVQVDEEALALAFTHEHAVTLPLANADPVIRLQLSRSTILDLVDGKFTLQEAILDGLVNVHGDLKDLVLFHEGWLAYMRGAIRCPSFPALLDRYRFAGISAE